jgi:peptidoglycan/LPS O-acetylase OafA/YrhL
VLVPYALASLLGQLYWLLRGSPRELTQIAEDLLLASTFGPYYYVFAIATLLLVTPLLAYIRARWLALGLAVLLVAYALRIVAATTAEVPPDPASLFWLLRDPSNGGTFFLAGWLAGLHSGAVRAWCERWRGRLWLPWGVGCAGLSVAAVWPGHATLAGLCAWLNIFALVGWVFVCSSRLPDTPGAIRWLSDSTYAIYLYHIFFVLSVLELTPPMRGPGQRVGLEVAAWLAGLLGACSITHAARVLLRDRARLWIGA